MLHLQSVLLRRMRREATAACNTSRGRDLCTWHDNGNWLVGDAAFAELSLNLNNTLQHNVINTKMQHSAHSAQSISHYKSRQEAAPARLQFISCKWTRQRTWGNLRRTWSRLKYLSSYCTTCCKLSNMLLVLLTALQDPMMKQKSTWFSGNNV